MGKPFQGIQEIPLNLLCPNPDQPRLERDETSADTLAKGIEEWGVWHPLLITSQGEKYKIISGEGRYNGAVKNKLETVPCRYLDDLDPAEVLLVALEENLLRRDLTVYEKTRGVLNWQSIKLGIDIEALQKLYYRTMNDPTIEVSNKRIIEKGARLLRMSVASVYTKCFALLRLKEDVKGALEQRQIAYTAALTLDSIEQATVRAQLLTRVIAKEVSQSQLEVILRGIKSKKRQHLAPRAKQIKKAFGKILETYQKLDDAGRLQLENLLASMQEVIQQKENHA
jgi:ParB family transcriptional regulator, chromosome partitioning protein